MNRRDFVRGAVAAGAVPALPGLPVAAKTGAAPAAINPFTYAWSAHYASLSRSISAEALARRFALPPDAAGAIFQRLQAAGIVSAPNAVGVAQVTRRFARPPVVARPVEAVKKAARKAIEDFSEADEAEKEIPVSEEDFTND